MPRGKRPALVPGLALGLLLALPAVAQTVDLGTEKQRAAGKVLYDKYCAQCHGDDGDGRGIAYAFVHPRPRDFTSGKYKIRTTPSGSLPTDEDLKSIIRRGMPYSSMPPWPQFSNTELQNLAYYLKTFSENFENPEYLAEGMTVPAPPASTKESIAKGREVYEGLGCIRCHGELGRGDGFSAPTLRDEWGDFLRVADLTARWTWRGGPTRADMFRTLTTGINGTPMPSYAAPALENEDRWHLVNYLDSLSPIEAPYTSLVVARATNASLELDDPEVRDGLLAGEGAFAEAEQAMFPLVGQIVQPGRNLHPLMSNVRVRAVYGPTEIAFLVQWNDMIADTSGSNSPLLEAPRFDPASVLSGSADTSGAEDDEGWGDDEDWGEEEDWGDEEDEDWDDEGWDDEEDEEDAGGSGSAFSDAVAIQLPVELPTGIQKPYFLFGDTQRPVDLWFVDLAAQAAQRFTARGSSMIEEIPGTDLTVAANYDRGQWSVVFKRDLRSLDGVSFEQDRYVPIAFTVWDGFSEDRGNKRALTQWVYVYCEPRVEQAATGPMLRAAGIVLLIELLIIGFVRWRHRRQPALQQQGVTA